MFIVKMYNSVNQAGTDVTAIVSSEGEANTLFWMFKEFGNALNVEINSLDGFLVRAWDKRCRCSKKNCVGCEEGKTGFAPFSNEKEG
jgi:hypothetical protein